MFNVPLSQAANIQSLPASTSCWKMFKEAYFGKNYFNFSGRASRKEYWLVPIIGGFLFLLLLSATMIIHVQTGLNLNIILDILQIYPIIPTWSLASRRFHDINMRAWWTFAILPNMLLPFVQGNKKDNRFGKNIY